jgi:hypothetical protein
VAQHARPWMAQDGRPRVAQLARPRRLTIGTLDAGAAPGYDDAQPARLSRLARRPLCALCLRLLGRAASESGRLRQVDDGGQERGDRRRMPFMWPILVRPADVLLPGIKDFGPDCTT